MSSVPTWFSPIPHSYIPDPPDAAGRPHCLALSSIGSCEDSAVTVLNSLSNTVLRQVPVSKTLILDGMSSFSMSLKEVLLWMILLPVAAHD